METPFITDVIIAQYQREPVLAFRDGAIVYLRGDVSDCAYLIKSGSVEVRQKGRAVETMRAGEIFGEMCLIDGGPRTATALARGNLEIIALDRSRFLALVRDDENFAMSVMRLLVRRHRATIDLFEECLRSTASSPALAA